MEERESFQSHPSERAVTPELLRMDPRSEPEPEPESVGEDDGTSMQGHA